MYSVQHKTLFFTALASLLVIVRTHGCSKFNLTVGSDEWAQFMEMEENFVPKPIKDTLLSYSNGTELTGIYDCHKEQGGFEVGVSAVCDRDGVCSCTALYNFEVCTSCELACGAAPYALNLGNFTADCSNVAGGYSDNCMVTCGYDTQGCYENASALVETVEATSSASLAFVTATAASVVALAVGVVALAVGVVALAE